MVLSKGNSLQANREAWEMSTKTGLLYHLHSLFIFTYSDIKAVIVPQAIFAVSSFFSYHDLVKAPHIGPPSTVIFTTSWRLLHMLFWLWLHLLILDVANQRLADSIAEDAINKPWRPLPANRLSPAEARMVLLCAVPLAMGLSLITGPTAYIPSTTLICLAWLYNDLEGSSVSIVTRNLLNAFGLTCFGWGALAVLAGPGAQIDFSKAAVWMAITASVIFTTVHVQDFRDEAGDRERGRRTISLVFSPLVARGSCALLILIWSVVAPAFWAGKEASECLVGMKADTQPPVCAWWVWVVSIGLGARVGYLLMARRGQRADEHALTVWCVWVAWVYLLPLLV